MVMSDSADRRAILSDSEILGHVRNVLRARGVPAQDVEDQLHEIVVHALRSPQLPLEREAAKKYLGGAAPSRPAMPRPGTPAPRPSKPPIASIRGARRPSSASCGSAPS